MSARKSYKPCMVLNRLFYSLRLHSDIPLGYCGGAVLQEPLDEGYVAAVGLVYLRSVPLAEAMRAYTVIAQIVADDFKLLLYRAL